MMRITDRLCMGAVGCGPIGLPEMMIDMRDLLVMDDTWMIFGHGESRPYHDIIDLIACISRIFRDVGGQVRPAVSCIDVSITTIRGYPT